jgi:hypothetical protein
MQVGTLDAFGQQIHSGKRRQIRHDLNYFCNVFGLTESDLLPIGYADAGSRICKPQRCKRITYSSSCMSNLTDKTVFDAIPYRTGLNCFNGSRWMQDVRKSLWEGYP